jgi:hypothetical protein
MMAIIDGPVEGHISLTLRSAEDYREAHRTASKARRLDMSEHLAPVDAEVNHGRWIVPCPKCNGAGFASRAWSLSCCFDCGTAYTRVVFPVAADAIEAALATRPREHRNWLPTETVDDLLRENRQHKVGST